MKKLLIIFFLPLLVFSCKNSENSANETSDTPEMERSDWANAHLKGKVKSIEETPYTPDESGNINEMDSCCVEIMEFSDKGFVMKVTEKNSDGTLDKIDTWDRAETGKGKSLTWTDENGELYRKRVFVRDEEGDFLHALDHDSTNQVFRFHIPETKNEFDQSTLGKSYLSDSTYVGTWSHQYIDGLRVGRGWIDSTNVQRVSRVGEVNDKGWRSRVVDVRVDENGDTTTTVETYTYDSFDEKGNWTQRTEKNDEKPVKVLKRTYTYY